MAETNKNLDLKRIAREKQEFEEKLKQSAEEHQKIMKETNVEHLIKSPPRDLKELEMKFVESFKKPSSPTKELDIRIDDLDKLLDDFEDFDKEAEDVPAKDSQTDFGKKVLQKGIETKYDEAFYIRNAYKSLEENKAQGDDWEIIWYDLADAIPAVENMTPKQLEKTVKDSNLTQKDAINKLMKGIDITPKKPTEQQQEAPTPQNKQKNPNQDTPVVTPKELFKTPSETPQPKQKKNEKR